MARLPVDCYTSGTPWGDNISASEKIVLTTIPGYGIIHLPYQALFKKRMEGIIISEKRRDDRGRILKTGETQRANGLYQYRYKDLRGKVRYVYSHTLDTLREKEAVIARDLGDGVDYSGGEISVLSLVDRYIRLKESSVRYNTVVSYNFVRNLIEKESFGFRKIKSVKKSEARQWFVKLYEDGRSYSTFTTVRGVVFPAFEMAVEDNLIRTNPFAFHVKDVVPNRAAKRDALSPEQEKRFLAFLQSDPCRMQYYNEVVILLETGLRISELYGLTLGDIDFSRNCIQVERQLQRTRNCEYYIERPKTESGNRCIPLSPDARAAFLRAIEQRRRVEIEVMVGGHVGFVFLDKDGKPKVAGHLEHALKRIVDHYNECYPEKINVTPHILRHTFATRLTQKGLPIKELQYLGGRADAGTPLNRYVHTDYSHAEQAFRKVVESG